MFGKGLGNGPTLADLDPGPDCPTVVRIIVEIPKHSTNKYEYDIQLDLIKLDRPLYSPVHYPGDYGFIPGTAGGDGDALDILVLTEEPTFPGCMIEVRAVGMLDLVDRKNVDSKILAVPDSNPRFDQIRTVTDVPPHVRKEIEHFFTIYKELEKKEVHIRGWRPRKDALAAIVSGRQSYLTNRRRKGIFSAENRSNSATGPHRLGTHR